VGNSPPRRAQETVPPADERRLAVLPRQVG
jgi:hypothetical protein